MLETNKIDDFLTQIKTKEFQQNLYAKTASKEYLVILELQLTKIGENLKSVECLVDNNHIEDAYTIFRKMLETYFLVNSVLVNPKIAKTYIVHDSMIAKKALNKITPDEVKRFTDGKPDGYLEYGFVEELVDTSEEGFKYTMKTVARAGEVEPLYKWYRVTSNFVHNNLTQLKINKEDLEDKIEIMCKTIVENIERIIDKYL